MLLGGNGSVSVAEQWVPSGIAALLVATVPIWMVLLDWARPGGVRPRAGAILGIVSGFLGVAVLIGPGDFGGGGVHPFGAGLLIFAALSWAVGSLYSRHAGLPDSALLATAIWLPISWPTSTARELTVDVASSTTQTLGAKSPDATTASTGI